MWSFSRFGFNNIMTFDPATSTVAIRDHDGQYIKHVLTDAQKAFIFHYGLKQKIFDGGALDKDATPGQKLDAVVKRFKAFVASSGLVPDHDAGSGGKRVSDDEKMRRSLLLTHSRIVNKTFKNDKEHVDWAMERIASPLADKLVERAEAAAAELAESVELE